LKTIMMGAALGLGSVPTAAMASVDAPEHVDMPAPPAGKGQVVFFRATGFAGSAISCAVKEGDTKVSSLPPGRFFVVVASPGKHIYSVSSEATDQIYFDLKPGQTHYVKCHVEMGIWAGRPKLEVAQEMEFSTKTWRSVDPSRIGPNVLTDGQIKSAFMAQSSAQPAATSAAVAAVIAIPSTAISMPATAPTAATLVSSGNH
jgi:hypothetical protein